MSLLYRNNKNPIREKTNPQRLNYTQIFITPPVTAEELDVKLKIPRIRMLHYCIRAHLEGQVCYLNGFNLH